MKPSIYSLTRQTMQEWVLEQGEKKFRADQIWEWLYRKRVQSFEEMTNLSKDLIAKLNDQFVVNPLKQRIVQESSDGTVKYLFELPDGMLIETVLMRQHYGLSVCVTTQVGCNIGCTFCASGLIKKQRDLNNGEIVAQIMLVQKYFDERGQDERVSHIVVMGIGEPFDNYNNVLNFVRTINDDKGMAIGARHITVSTSGLAHKIRDFANMQNMSMLDASANIMLSGIKGKAAQAIWDFANLILDLRERLDQLTITELVEEVLDKTGYMTALTNQGNLESQARIENIQEFLSVTKNFDDNPDNQEEETGLDSSVAS